MTKIIVVYKQKERTQEEEKDLREDDKEIQLVMLYWKWYQGMQDKFP